MGFSEMCRPILGSESTLASCKGGPAHHAHSEVRLLDVEPVEWPGKRGGGGVLRCYDSAERSGRSAVAAS